MAGSTLSTIRGGAGCAASSVMCPVVIDSSAHGSRPTTASSEIRAMIAVRSARGRVTAGTVPMGRPQLPAKIIAEELI